MMRKAEKYEKPQVEMIEIILGDIITLSEGDMPEAEEGAFGELV